MTTSSFDLIRNPFGRLTLTSADGQVFENVSPVRAFPIQAPDHGIAMVCADGQEVAWIDGLQDLPATVRALVEEELGGREFMPEIARIVDVTSYATPCTWSVITDRGETHFVLRGEEDIRRIGPDTLLVSDTHGIHFLIRNMFELDKHSKKILDRFL
ncbi:DUF1854 domain-containing protein [Undibacterium arcticum]|uniref:DUF1854 domain-containing protein n=1 Tax=Undibacterium arcticum TaxID=1762892 RepID=A0ABV7EXI7_9BURK